MFSSLTIAVLIGPILFASDEESNEAQARIAATRVYFAKAAAQFEFKLNEDDEQPLALVKSPVMRWSNNPGPWIGDLFVWTRQGRPEVIGCLFSGPPRGNRRSVFQEFHLLSEKPLALSRTPSGALWEPREGLRLRPIPGIEAPADKPALRLAQMRGAVQDFSAHMTENDKTLMNLRSLPQPLFRYQPDDGPVIDGALFTYVSQAGTDPEFILLLECRKTDDGPRWFYAPVRFTNREVWLKHRNVEVWRDARHDMEGGLISTSPYMARPLETIPAP